MKEILLILRGLLAEKFTIEYDVFYNLPLLKMNPENMEKHGRSGSSDLPVWNPVLNKSLSGEKLMYWYSREVAPPGPVLNHKQASLRQDKLKP